MVRFLLAEGAAVCHNVKTSWSTVGRNHPFSYYPHTANQVSDKFERFGLEILQHPPYSSDLSPCDFYILATRDVKKDIRGRRTVGDLHNLAGQKSPRCFPLKITNRKYYISVLCT